MKIGIISDIHSNIDALKKAFEEFDKQNIEKVICAGDVIGIGPFPEKCIDFLMENKDRFIVMIRGNHEGYLLEGVPLRNHNRKNGRLMTEVERSMHSWNHNRLREDQVKFIESWNKKEEIEIEGKKIIVEHYPTNSKGNFKKFYRIPTYKQINEIAEIKEANIYIFGHTHEDIYYHEENKFYINPGSLGCPIKTGGANLGILEITNDKIEYHQLSPKYDVDKVIKEIEELSYPIYNEMIEIFYRKKWRD